MKKKKSTFGSGRPPVKRNRRSGDYYNCDKEEIEKFDNLQRELKKKALERLFKGN